VKSIYLNTRQIIDLVHFANVIPIAEGLSQKFVAENYPGWEWNDIVPVLVEKSILIKEENSGYIKIGNGLFMDAKINGLTIHFHTKQVDIDSK